MLSFPHIGEALINQLQLGSGKIVSFEGRPCKEQLALGIFLNGYFPPLAAENMSFPSESLRACRAPRGEDSQKCRSLSESGPH